MIKNTKLRSEGVKRARELIYTAERQASRDVGLAGLRLKPGSSQRMYKSRNRCSDKSRVCRVSPGFTWFHLKKA
jgi:hypothetical protein